jgi:PTS system glucose-specific IIA component
MWFNFKLSKEDENDSDLTLIAPISGTAIPIEDVPDVVFSEKIVGDGIAIKPTSNKVVAPCDCIVESIFKTKHALILKTIPYDLLLFIHIGVDTIDLGSNEIFSPLVKEGDTVKSGEPIMDFNLDLLQKRLKSTISPILISANSLPNLASLEKMTERCTHGSTPIMKIKLKSTGEPEKE